jgi:hypothetical protein
MDFTVFGIYKLSSITKKMLPTPFAVLNDCESNLQNNKNQYIAHPTKNSMENEFRNSQRNAYEIFRIIKDLVMSVLFMGMAAVMFFPLKFGLENIAFLDALFRYFFGGICILYGVFRLYRALKKDY